MENNSITFNQIDDIIASFNDVVHNNKTKVIIEREYYKITTYKMGDNLIRCDLKLK